MKFSSLTILVSYFFFVLIAGDMLFFPFLVPVTVLPALISVLWFGLNVDGLKIQVGRSRYLWRAYNSDIISA